MQEVYFFFDDSGVFHANEKSGFFVYAGYVFTSRKELDEAKRRYTSVNKTLKKALEFEGELKAAKLENKYRRALFNSMKGCHCVSCAVNLSKIYKNIINDKHARCRYKDYIIKRCVKAKLHQLIACGEILANESIHIHLNIDEQLTSSDGFYSLKDSITEELQHGIINFDYGTFFEPTFSKDVTVNLKYCESSKNYMIQASDIFANRIWSSYKNGRQGLREGIGKHLHLTLP